MSEKSKVIDFKKIYEEQKRFQELIKATYDINDKESFLKDLLLHINSETFEVLNEINWKMHRKEKKSIDENKLIYEMVDVIKYALSLPASWGFSAEDVERVFWEKSKIVEQRFQQEIINKDFNDNDKLVGIDIDGVIVKYPEGFIKFVYDELNITDKNPEDFVLEKYALYDELAEELSISKTKITELKHKFRISGFKRNLDIYINAKIFIDWLRQNGYKVVLLSARPIKQYPNIFYDTIFNLKKHNINYDGIYFSENKEQEIIKRFPNIIFFIEDCAENAEKITEIGKKVFLIDKTYNKKIKQNDLIIRVNEIGDIKKWLK